MSTQPTVGRILQVVEALLEQVDALLAVAAAASLEQTQPAPVTEARPQRPAPTRPRKPLGSNQHGVRIGGVSVTRLPPAVFVDPDVPPELPVCEVDALPAPAPQLRFEHDHKQIAAGMVKGYKCLKPTYSRRYEGLGR